jgi:hypothetical protein
MGQFVDAMQLRFKKSTSDLVTLGARLISGFLLGLTFTLAGQEAIGYGAFAFWFVIIMVMGVFLRISRKWRLLGVLIFDLICVLIGMLLRLYVIMAPGV